MAFYKRGSISIKQSMSKRGEKKSVLDMKRALCRHLESPNAVWRRGFKQRIERFSIGFAKNDQLRTEMCNLSRNAIARQVARIITQCNITCKGQRNVAKPVTETVAESRIEFYFPQRLQRVF